MKKFISAALLLISFNLNAQFNTTTIISGLQYPIAFDWLPGGNYLITLKGGSSLPAVNAKIMSYYFNGTPIGVFYDLTDSVNADFERGLLGICVDVNFNINHYVYAYYNHNYNGDERIRVVRFTEVNYVGTNPTIILDIDVSNSIAGNHVGGNIHQRIFQPDKLYISIGDIAVSSNAQVLTNPYGKFLRINTDGTIPTDNPFYDDGDPLTGNDDRIWTYGHRNPFDFCVSPVNDSIYSSENGLNTWDEANLIVKGKNYGWNVCEGNYLNSSTTNLCTNPAFTNPITTWGAPLPSVTGIMVYSGNVIPQFDNHMLVADNNYGRIFDCTLAPPLYQTVSSNVLWMDLTTSGGLTTIRQGSDGCIYAMKGGYTTSGAIYKVCPSGVGMAEQINELREPIIVPNPASSTAQLKFILQQQSRVRVKLFDLSGKMIHDFEAREFKVGLNEWNLDVSKLKNGFYDCTVISENEEVHLKLSVMH